MRLVVRLVVVNIVSAFSWMSVKDPEGEGALRVRMRSTRNARGIDRSRIESFLSMRRRGGEAAREDPAELAALADGSLPPERRSALEASVAASPELSDLLDEQRRALALAHGAAASVEAPPGLRARIEAERGTRRRRPVARIALGGAVAAAAVGIGVAVFVLQNGTPAERFRASLAATSLAPGATGRATLTKTPSGWRIELRATGLPRLDAGRFYQAWLKNAAGVLVPIGTFNDGRKVTLWAGVSPRQFQTITVTRERADGDQGSSGEKVLVGSVASGG
jgi:anti-sigma-K factor RskA